ncbi:MAG: helicase-exonuclease AddAB subunit AddA [Candidatus Merdivicinus sp.]|jgi:ATP-dependent helicase/nuclease subunit A
MSRQWTPEQLAAIHTSGGGILVSAAAGSGKTAVLVERIISRITDPENPLPADRLLVVTFTNAAASEMRGRVDARLRELLHEMPGNPLLEQQLIRLQKAKICTMDAFFGSMVRENFEKLGISPGIRIAEEAELADLRAGAMEQILEQSYQEEHPDFLAAATYFGEQSDQRLTEEVLTLFEKIRSIPRPQLWFRRQQLSYEHPAAPEDTDWGSQLLAHIRQTFQNALRINAQIREKLFWDEKLAKGYGAAIQADRALFEEGIRIASYRNWDALCHFLSQNDMGAIGRAPKGSDELLKEEISALRSLCKDFWAEARECVPGTSADFFEDCAFLLPVIRGIFRLTSQFQAEFFAAKQEANLADFGDMAEFALQLCTDEEGVPTDFAREYARNFDEILLDEYQDTNRLQDEIFHAISQNGENLFFVGDLKQSIYRFRSADPTVFAEKQARFATDGTFPALLRLSRNFRSRPDVLHAVNFFFSQLMSEQAGGVRYDEAEAVHPGATYPDRPNPCLEIQLIDMENLEDSSRILIEAQQTARRIARMLREGYPVSEDGNLRPCRPTDFAILLRSLKGVEAIFCEAIQNEGVEAAVSSAEGYFTSREVLSMISLLQVLDNPLQDIPLAAVLLSPLGMFTCDELASLRLRHPDMRLYSALLAEQNGSPKIEAILSLLASLREKAAVKRVRALIQYIYDSTDFLEIMAGSSGREANLKLLLQYAGDYERSGRNELSGFVAYIRRMMDRGDDFKVANPLSTENGMVQIMSVHKSKGLEFPIVILANCSKAFNQMDSNRPALFHPALGYGIQVIDRSTLRRYPTLSSAAVRLREQEDTVSEEIRLLYVAMTRARETLILNITEKNLEKRLRNVAALIPEDSAALDPSLVLQMTSWSQWLLAALLRHPDFAPICRQYGVAASPIPANFSILLRTSLVRPEEFLPETDVKPELSADPALVQRISEQIFWKYPWRSRTVIPAKLAVTDIVRREEEDAGQISLPMPAFTQKEGFSAAERGTIFHRALQFADYAAGRADPAAELQRLTDARYLTPEEAAVIPLTAFSRFFHSEMMARILSADKIWREYRFFDTVPASRAGYEGEDPILIQGVADCLFEEDGAGVLLDYKTDHASPAELIQRYSLQINLYRKALSPLFPKGIKECILYSLYQNQPVPIPEPADDSEIHSSIL